MLFWFAQTIHVAATFHEKVNEHVIVIGSIHAIMQLVHVFIEPHIHCIKCVVLQPLTLWNALITFIAVYTNMSPVFKTGFAWFSHTLCIIKFSLTFPYTQI